MKSLPRLSVYGTTGRTYFYQCPQCGAPILADPWSEYVSERQVRNVSSCEACGYQIRELHTFRRWTMLRDEGAGQAWVSHATSPFRSGTGGRGSWAL